jgi:ribosomal protein S18 acetylase RimI-like enzyme
MRTVIQIRPAQPDDAEVAALLLYSAYTHTSISAPPQGELEPGWIERLQDFFRQDGNRCSYQNIQVAQESSAVVGLVLSFGGRDEARLNAALGSWLEQEAEDDEWYVDALAVFSNWSRQGIGTSLMERAERLAIQQRYPKIALHVAQENTPALNLYTQLHYVVMEQTVLYQRPFVRMVKTLEGSREMKE